LRDTEHPLVYCPFWRTKESTASRTFTILRFVHLERLANANTAGYRLKVNAL
jgi:hypothetical protein